MMEEPDLFGLRGVANEKHVDVSYLADVFNIRFLLGGNRIRIPVRQREPIKSWMCL